MLIYYILCDIICVLNEKEIKMNLTELYAKADYQDEMGMLFHGDCMNLLKEIDDNCVDLCLTDPPLRNEFSIA